MISISSSRFGGCRLYRVHAPHSDEAKGVRFQIEQKELGTMIDTTRLANTPAARALVALTLGLAGCTDELLDDTEPSQAQADDDAVDDPTPVEEDGRSYVLRNDGSKIPLLTREELIDTSARVDDATEAIIPY